MDGQRQALPRHATHVRCGGTRQGCHCFALDSRDLGTLRGRYIGLLHYGACIARLPIPTFALIARATPQGLALLLAATAHAARARAPAGIGSQPWASVTPGARLRNNIIARPREFCAVARACSDVITVTSPRHSSWSIAYEPVECSCQLTPFVQCTPPCTPPPRSARRRRDAA